jgi:hypothetical protein
MPCQVTTGLTAVQAKDAKNLAEAIKNVADMPW